MENKEEKRIFGKAERAFFNEKTAQLFLERSTLAAEKSKEALENSTNRAYNLLGFLVGAFTALTAFISQSYSSVFVIPALILWAGFGRATYIMFRKAIGVHYIMNIGGEPRLMVSESNIKYIQEHFEGKEQNTAYRKNIIFDNIQYNQLVIDTNNKRLATRVIEIAKVMDIVKTTLLLAAQIFVLCYIFTL